MGDQRPFDRKLARNLLDGYYQSLEKNLLGLNIDPAWKNLVYQYHKHNRDTVEGFYEGNHYRAVDFGSGDRLFLFNYLKQGACLL